MGTYILKRLLLIIPTLFFILLLNFVVIQIAPGGRLSKRFNRRKVLQGWGKPAAKPQ